MQIKNLCILFVYITLTAPTLLHAASPFTWHTDSDHELTIKNKLKIESVYGRNLRLLNSDNDTDQILIPARHIWDLEILYNYGKKTYCNEIIAMKTGIRNRGTWGAPESIAKTASTTIRDSESVVGAHKHSINVHIPIIRELWLEFEVNKALAITPCNRHVLTLGLFPFQLGRGIALGSAYAVAPDFIGYNPADAVQQFAPGIRLSGSLAPAWKYDLYSAILDNKTDTFENTNEKIRGQEYDHRFDQARGYGIMNYIFAMRSIFTPCTHNGVKITIEPYLMHSHDDEQKIEFIGDASSRLTTIGAAFEGSSHNFELGFEAAVNMGSQRVAGIDRNTSIRTLSLVDAHKTVDISPFPVVDYETSAVTIANSSVGMLLKQDSPDSRKAYIRAPYTVANQKRINAVPQTMDQNGKEIPKKNPADPNEPTLFNSPNRFHDPYQNKYLGSMAVCDCQYNYNSYIQAAATFGFASGDENPNRDLNNLGDSQIDGDYKGFISLQETYSGKRVRSAFLMSGSGKIPRIASIPADNEDLIDGSIYASQVSQFTNLGFVGAALWIKTEIACHEWKFNPNILSYWQTYPSHIFNTQSGRYDNNRIASPSLGIEGNIYIDTILPHGLKLSLIAGFFVPGKHFEDIKGVPLNKDEQKIFNNPNQTGINIDRVPVHGNDTAYFYNISLEYSF